MKKLPLLVFIIGSCVSLIILACSFLFLNAEQCPTGYSGQQAQESGCIIGANIGLGLGILASMALGALAVVTSIILLLLPRVIRIFKGRRP